MSTTTVGLPRILRGSFLQHGKVFPLPWRQAVHRPLVYPFERPYPLHFHIHSSSCLYSAAGVPTVVARRMLSGSGPALIGRVVSDEAAAVTAAADGANLVLVTVSAEVLREIVMRETV